MFHKLLHYIKQAYHSTTALAAEFYAIFIFNITHLNRGKVHPYQFHGLNPETLTDEESKKPAILFLHGQGHNQSGALPLAKELNSANISPVFTLNLYYDEKNPQTHEQLLRKRIHEIQTLYHEKGKQKVDLILVGHSRGGIEALNYICHEPPQKNLRIKAVITIASRLADVPSSLRGCPSRIKSLIQKIMKEKHKHHPILYHVVSNKDWVVPLEAAISNKDNGHCHIVTNRSHMAILYAKETHDKVIEYIRQNS